MIRVYWDTMLFAYWAEGSTEFGPRIRAIHEAMVSRGDRRCASQVTLCELLVFGWRSLDAERVGQWQAYFQSPAIEVLPLTAAAAPYFAQLRAGSGIAAVDALHLAIAGSAGVDVFLTNDRRLQRVRAPGIGFIAGLDVNLY